MDSLLIKEFTASKETIGYVIIVKNKESIPISIEILDQIPVSQNNIIQIDLEEKGVLNI